MAKAIVGTLIIIDRNALITKTGTLVSHDGESVTLDVKRDRSSKTDRETFSLSEVLLAWLAEGDNASVVQVRGVSEDSYADVTLTEVSGGFFSGTSDDVAVMAAPGNWRFLPSAVDVEEEKPAKGGKAVTKEKAAPAKAKPEPKAEEPEAEAAYEPAVGDTVTVTDEDGDVTTGVVEKLTATVITVDGAKHKLADVTVEAAEAEAEAEAEAYEPAVGDYVTVTDADGDETVGTVKVATAKKITLTEDDGEEQSFITSKVTVEEAVKPVKKAAAAKGKAAPAAAKEKAQPKAAKEVVATADDDAEWGND